MKRIDLIIGEIADQLIANTIFGGVREYTYYRHPNPLVISKFSFKHRTKKHQRAELIKALKHCWNKERKYRQGYDSYGDTIPVRWGGRGVFEGIGRYLKLYRRRIKHLEAVGYDINIRRPDELPDNVKVYLDYGCNITKQRIGIHLLNPTVQQTKSALNLAEAQGIEAVYIYEEDTEFRGEFVKTKGLAFNGTFHLTETELISEGA